MPVLGAYRYRGARALVLLHERELRAFVLVWRRAVARGVALPVTDDPSYTSLNALARHVLGSAGGYLRWIARHLELPDPAIDPVPPVHEIERHVDAYLEHLVDRWRLPLRDVAPERFRASFRSEWGLDYSIAAMLEHALAHPMRHAFQLEELMDDG
jgi:hypothetical protein